MKHKFLLFNILILLIASSCNLPLSAPTETPIPFTATPVPATETPLPTNTAFPTNTPLPTLTFTPSVPTVITLDQAVNCRFGPSQAWLAISALNLGQSSQIVGKNSNASWWYIQDPLNAGRNCWVSASVTSATGNLANVPVVQTPSASVTNVTVRAQPREISLPGCIGPLAPIKINGTIETNGPTTVSWHFETQQGGAMPNKTTEFDTFGTKEVSADYTPIVPPIPGGTFWVRLVVTDPNDLFAEGTYEIEC